MLPRNNPYSFYKQKSFDSKCVLSIVFNLNKSHLNLSIIGQCLRLDYNDCKYLKQVTIQATLSCNCSIFSV